MTDENLQFLILYFLAHIISISSCYAYFYFSSLLVSKGGVKSAILLLISYILFIILVLLLPMRMIDIGLHLVNAWEWKGNLVFLIYIIWLIPPAMIGIRKNRKTEATIKKIKEMKKRNR